MEMAVEQGKIAASEKIGRYWHERILGRFAIAEAKALIGGE